MNFKILLLAFSLVLLSACRAKERTIVVQGEIKRISTAGPCPILVPTNLKKGIDYECGTIISPVDKDKTDAGDLRVSYFRVLAKNRSNLRSPVVLHFGGPGDDGQGPFEWAISKRDSLADDRDLIAIGQRGTTHSFVIPECPRAPSAGSLEATIAAERENSALCKQLLDNAGITLSAFSTLAGVRDVEALRIGLGYAKVSFYGVSYGTMFALEYARQFPTTVDRMILDSVIPPNQNMGESHVDEFTDIARYLKYLSTNCASSAQCAAAYGGSVPDFSQSLELVMGYPLSTLVLQGNPLDKISTLAVGRSFGMSTLKRVIFASIIQAGAEQIGTPPDQITFTAAGVSQKMSQQLSIWRSLGVPLPSDTDLVGELLGGGGGLGGFSPGINEFLNCTESGFTLDSAVATFSDARYSYVGPNLRQQVTDFAKIREATCNSFLVDAQKWRETFGKPVQSSARAYLFNSTYDSATPLKHAKLAKASLSDSTLFEFSCSAHAVLPGASEECSTPIFKTALDGTLSQSDVDCVCN